MRPHILNDVSAGDFSGGGRPPIEILLAEDSPADVRMTREALKEGRLPSVLRTVSDGVEALAYLRQEGEYQDAPMPDLMLLDLNMPRKDGREVLAEIKSDPRLRTLPVLVLTTSTSGEDIRTTYDLHANCYIAKPGDIDEFVTVVRAIEEFWVSTVRLPTKECG